MAAAAAGCGSGTKTEPLIFTKRTSTTIANPKTGVLVRCQKVSAKVPAEGAGVAITGDGTSSSPELQLTRLPDNSLLISCKP